MFFLCMTSVTYQNQISVKSKQVYTLIFPLPIKMPSLSNQLNLLLIMKSVFFFNTIQDKLGTPPKLLNKTARKRDQMKKKSQMSLNTKLMILTSRKYL